MQVKSVLVAVAASATLASASPNFFPAHPLAARQTDASPTDAGSAPTDTDVAFPSYLTDFPTFPASYASVLETAVPSSVYTQTDLACAGYNGQKPAWFTTLPSDLQSALTSYATALNSWASEHSSELASITSTISLPTCSGAAQAAATASSSAAAANTVKSTTTTKSAASGSAAAASASGTGTSSAKNAAARPTGVLAAGLVGAVGVLGLAVGL